MEQRAWEVDGEYRTHARQIDRQVSPAGTTPVLDRLQSYGRVRGLAFGHYAEWSTDVDLLLDAAATARAQRDWRARGARSMQEARAVFIALYRRRLGCFVAREMARHRLRRLPFVGATRAQVRARGRRGDAQLGAGADGGGVRAEDYYAYAYVVAP